uniref:Uncharacterized protein n=1 Tax=Anguilla anguilla TaxID=7936 RepID=A0A0E9T2A1_ANGAN
MGNGSFRIGCIGNDELHRNWYASTTLQSTSIQARQHGSLFGSVPASCRRSTFY